jgi:hypothetical protein
MRYLLFLAAMLTFNAPASAAVLTYDWVGFDPINGDAHATLVLDGYTPGTELTESNLVSFTYSSPLTDTYTFNVGDGIFGLLGSLGATPGSYEFEFGYLISDPFTSGLTTASDGSWTSIYGSADGGSGPSHQWSLVRVPDSAVPEPAAWMMMFGGIGLIGGVLRRRHVTARFA